jgi:transporter family protein
MDYRAWALLSALFAGLTAVLSKVGVAGVPSNLALAIRVTFVLAVTWLFAWGTKQTDFSSLNQRTVLWLGLSAVATGASWLCYFRALQMGPVSGVAPIDKLSFVVAMVLGVLILKERIGAYTLAGSALIIMGVGVTLMQPR